MSTTETEHKKSRSFKVKLDQESAAYGRYNGDSPYQAANKALSELVRNVEKEGKDSTGEYIFWLIESTKGSKKRVHQYKGRRVKLDEPVEYIVNGTAIKKFYKNLLKKIKKEEQTLLITKSTKRTKVVAKKPKATKKAGATTKKATATKKATTASTKKVAATKKATGATTKKATGASTKKVASPKTATKKATAPTKAAPKKAKA